MQDSPTNATARPFKWVGTRPVRPDGVPKVTGRALYGSDLTMPGMLVGRILRSPHAHARIRSIDAWKAAALPGVKAVVTSADFPEQKFEYFGPERVQQNYWHMTRNIMAREKVLYEGHAVAAVAAASKAIADQALALIEVDYHVLPHVIDVDEAMKPNAPLLFDDLITRGVEPPPKSSNISKGRCGSYDQGQPLIAPVWHLLRCGGRAGQACWMRRLDNSAAGKRRHR
jgi:CO/xanthine dehydrogenase Mo-binding subunit